jgi:L-fuculose-phosphate aldolase
VLEAERTCVATAARALAAGSLVPGTSGNISVLAGELVAISASGAALERLEPAHVVVVDRDGRLREGEGAPSSELALHLAIYRQFPSARAVVHAHPACGTALASVLDELPVVHYAAATVDALAGRTAALMANHGAVTHGGDLASAVAAMELLEWLCALHLRAAALGTPRTLDREEQRAVQEAFTLQEAAKR